MRKINSPINRNSCSKSTKFTKSHFLPSTIPQKPKRSPKNNWKIVILTMFLSTERTDKAKSIKFKPLNIMFQRESLGNERKRKIKNKNPMNKGR